MWWGEKKTFVEVTRPWYVQALPFLLKFYVPTCRQRAAENRARYCKGHALMTDSELENKVGQIKSFLNLEFAEQSAGLRSSAVIFPEEIVSPRRN